MPAVLTASLLLLGAAAPTSTWTRLVEHAPFSIRDTAEPFQFDGKLWLSNGYGADGKVVRDLWNSADGVTWTRVLDATPYDPYAEIAVYHGKIWAVKQSVWSSADGLTWTKVLDATPFGVRGYGELLVHDGKLWHYGSGADVWWTTDGVTWTRAIEQAPFGSRYGTADAVFAGKLWLLGGATHEPNNPPEAGYKDYTTHNDVWSSPDGEHWTRVLEHAPWAERMWSVAEVFGGRLYLFGGYSNRNKVNFAEVWSTADGTTWEQLDTPTIWSARHEPTIYVFGDKLWLVAGNMWPLMNDVWRLDPR